MQPEEAATIAPLIVTDLRKAGYIADKDTYEAGDVIFKTLKRIYHDTLEEILEEHF